MGEALSESALLIVVALAIAMLRAPGGVSPTSWAPR
jgi:hypothetical protein